MTAPTPEQTKNGYRAMWDRAVVADAQKVGAETIAKRINVTRNA